jgi:hypothetical protein
MILVCRFGLCTTSLKGEARRFLANSASPPFCINPSKIQRLLVQLFGIRNLIPNSGHNIHCAVGIADNVVCSGAIVTSEPLEMPVRYPWRKTTFGVWCLYLAHAEHIFMASSYRYICQRSQTVNVQGQSAI